MTTTLKNKTRINIKDDARIAIVGLLNARLADGLDYAARVKQAHWNLKGQTFMAVHEMLDTMYAEVTGFNDMVAERAVQLGGLAEGTLQQAAARTALAPYPPEIQGIKDHLRALADSLATFTNAARAGIDTCDSHGDAITADLLTEVSRGLDKQLWFIEAHLAG